MNLLLVNQYGEESVNVPSGLILTGASAPVNTTTGKGVSPLGGLYFAADTGVMYQNTGTIDSPTWAPFTGGAAGGSYAETAPSVTFDHSVGAKALSAIQIGNLVSLTIPSGAISNGAGTVCASTALPSSLRPAAAVTFGVLVIDNGTTRKAGQVVIGSDGVITFSVLGTGFTTGQAAGWDSCSVSYAIA